jgi:hypothetical protein
MAVSGRDRLDLAKYWLPPDDPVDPATASPAVTRSPLPGPPPSTRPTDERVRRAEAVIQQTRSA